MQAAIRQSNAVFARAERIQAFEMQKLKADKEICEKRDIAKYYREHFKSKSSSDYHSLNIVMCTEADIRFKSKIDLIAHCERKLTHRRQNIAAMIIQRAWRAHMVRVNAVKARLRNIFMSVVRV